MSSQTLSTGFRGAEPASRSGVDVAVAHTSGVSWGAVFAGAVGAAALSLILLILGTGLGLSSVSPWASQGASAATFGFSTIAWLTFTQLAASGMGGYLAGRLRTKWVSLHGDEVYFRDTAHGFLAWSVATLVTAAFLTSAIGAIVNGGVQAGATAAGGAATAVTAGAAGGAMNKSDSGAGEGDGAGAGLGYFIDSLFRKDVGPAAPAADSAAISPAASTAEVTRIFVNDLRSGSLPPEDARYVGKVVALRTGMPPAEAEKRVTETFAKLQAEAQQAATAAKDAADKTRKASSYAALWLFVSLLVGAFVASLAATFGGRQRDL